MASSRSNPQETFFLFVVIVVGAIIVIATYFLQIVFFIGATLLGAGLGFLVSRALGHMGKRWGYAGIFELILVAVGFRFLFGIPFAFDSWRGAFTYFGQGSPVSPRYRDVLWIVVGVVTMVATGVWSAVKESPYWDETSEETQNGATQMWSEITELLFWAPKLLAKRFFSGRGIASYGVVITATAGLGACGFYLRESTVMAPEILLNTAILVGVLTLFREPLSGATRREVCRAEWRIEKRLARIEANRLEQLRLDEERRIVAEKQEREQEKRAAEYEEKKRVELEKARLIKEAIEEARPGQGKRTDLTAIHEKDLRGDDLF